MIIQSKNIWYQEKFQPLQVVIEGSKIKEIVPYLHYNDPYDVDQQWVLPGFIDLHCHGYHGCNVNYATLEGLKIWNETLPKEGVTSYLLTSSTAPWDSLTESYKILNDFIRSNPQASHPLGIHNEGPFISKQYKGAQNDSLILTPSIEKIKELMDIAPGQLKMIALAVEHDADFEVTKFCSKHDIIVALGHSGASFDMAAEAAKHGAKNFTHTFNAMPQLHHREPGLIGAALTFDHMYAEVIADGVHVDFALVNVLGKMKGKDKLITVTDAVAFKGLPMGVHQLKDRTVEIDEHGSGRLLNGRLAGSSNRMDTMLRNLIHHTHLDLPTCINSVSKNPANLLNLKSKGLLEVGNDADIVITNPQIIISETYSRGIRVFKEE